MRYLSAVEEAGSSFSGDDAVGDAGDEIADVVCAGDGRHQAAVAQLGGLSNSFRGLALFVSLFADCA